MSCASRCDDDPGESSQSSLEAAGASGTQLQRYASTAGKFRATRIQYIQRQLILDQRPGGEDVGRYVLQHAAICFFTCCPRQPKHRASKACMDHASLQKKAGSSMRHRIQSPSTHARVHEQRIAKRHTFTSAVSSHVRANHVGSCDGHDCSLCMHGEETRQTLGCCEW